MKKVFFALILSFFSANFCLADENLLKFEEECKSVINKPKVKVLSSYGKLQYDFTKNNAYLKKETEKKYNEQNAKMPNFLEPVGLTKVRDNFEFNMNIGQIEVSRGYKCFYPESIDVYLGYSFPVIYVSKELKEGSCMYDVTIRHEKTHMQMYIDGLDYFLPQLKRTVKGLYDDVGVKVVKNGVDYQEVARELNEAYLSIVENKITKWREDINNEQMKLDSLEHYVLENRICEEEEEFIAEKQNKE